MSPNADALVSKQVFIITPPLSPILVTPFTLKPSFYFYEVINTDDSYELSAFTFLLPHQRGSIGICIDIIFLVSDVVRIVVMGKLNHIPYNHQIR